MTVAIDTHFRGWTHHHAHAQAPALTLQDRYEIHKEIGDGSFGSVVLGRTRSAGATVVRRGTMVAIKTMKKSFDSFAQCMELREVIFLKSLPNHPHLVPAYDIFLDPLSRKLHIAMEYMDGNLYQLMKSREQKPLDGTIVKSILYQILAGLEHIHEHNFFHRDIKPENILVSSSSPETANAFKRYSAIMTPPSTPPTYTIKLADFGLARETRSRTPYTTYVSTRWYRAPEVLLRAGEYSAPVDIWALGAMAVEIATLKPLFPGANEVDQVWRVCEIMGSPGLWVNKNGDRVGGGEWKDGIKLAQKLGFSFPKMAPHSLTTVLPPSQWPASLAEFITWCLMWDPKARPTSTQALNHPYFADAVDPLRPKSSAASKRLGSRKGLSGEAPTSPYMHNKGSSWFRRSLGPREMSGVIAADQASPVQPLAVRPSPSQADLSPIVPPAKQRSVSTKRTTWVPQSTSSTSIANAKGNTGAPIHILPSIRPISPLPAEVNAQGSSTATSEKPAKKLGRQLSVNSSGNHHADLQRLESENALVSGNMPSPSGQSKESFFAHLRKRARRISGKHYLASPPPGDDLEAYFNAHGEETAGNMNIDNLPEDYDPASPSKDSGFAELDKVLQNVRHNLEAAQSVQLPPKQPQHSASMGSLRRLSQIHKGTERQNDAGAAPIGVRNRRSMRHTLRQDKHYETPDEEDELNEALLSAKQTTHKAETRRVMSLEKKPLPPPKNDSYRLSKPTPPVRAHPYLTPSPSKENNSLVYPSLDFVSTKPLDINKTPDNKNSADPQWPTPPYEDSEWTAATYASIFAAQAAWR